MSTKVVLTSGKVVENVDPSVFKRSVKLKKMLRSATGDTMKIKGVRIDDDTWDKVYDWLLFHKNSVPSFEGINGDDIDALNKVTISSWETAFLEMPSPLLMKVMQAAGVLKIEPLLELTCRCFKNIISGMTPAEIREEFGIVNDFTPEEEEEVRAENQRFTDFEELAARLGHMVLPKKK